ncbi:MAG: glycine dehydrogenase, partial [Deltaproteobacteria bacterium]|nr:glycine dehydrogenase [Deltaproteobacteria bacterium]
PGGHGVDAAAGEGQSLGLPLSFGGPYVGLFAVASELVKSMPGRLVGMTSDARGNPCYTLTLAAREQHIRRGRASSNICTNEGLCATAVAMYLSMLGREGLPRLAMYNHHRAGLLKTILAGISGVSLPFSGPTFNEFVVRLSRPADEVVRELSGEGIVPGLDLGVAFPAMSDCLLVSVTERASDDDFDRLASALGAT